MFVGSFERISVKTVTDIIIIKYDKEKCDVKKSESRPVVRKSGPLGRASHGPLNNR